jgi:hypothetical protein
MVTRLGFLALILVLGLSSVLPVLAGSRTNLPQPPTPNSPALEYRINLPAVMGKGMPSIELQKAWTTTPQNVLQSAYLVSSSLQYHLSGKNNHDTPLQADLTWTQQASCGPTAVFTDTVSLPPGEWEQSHLAAAPDCTGIITSTVEIVHRAITYTLNTQFAVNTPSVIIVDNHQGFDRCNYPSVQEMQTWWDKSPYWVFNLYLGGSSFACRNRPLDPVWVHQVAEQGWNYILTWVGPQAPCSDFLNKMSSNATTARNQGRAEADAAFDSATHLGFFGDMVIYYDLENFSPATTSCRETVKAFMRGWVERLHEHNLRAGGYGGSYSSYISDWDTISPKPDDVWLARWLLPAVYRPTATVWGDPYVPDSLWPNHQRIRQYAGGHTETWGSASLIIDSNVLDGHITSLFGLPVASTLAPPTQVVRQGSVLNDAGLIGAGRGWVLSGERLLLTDDDGVSWQDISPSLDTPGRVLGVAFAASGDGWMALQSYDPAGSPGIQVLHRQGSVSWQDAAWLHAAWLPLNGEEAAVIENAHFDLAVSGLTRLALELQSGSSFSLGRLFASRDSGLTWQERSLPLGEAAHFSDELNGWTYGGPTGDALYSTQDGGYTWQAADPADASASATTSVTLRALQLEAPDGVSLPSGTVEASFVDGSNGWVRVQESTCQGIKNPATAEQAALQPFVCQQQDRLLSTQDGGNTWSEITP